MSSPSQTTLALVRQYPFLSIASSHSVFPGSAGDGLPLLVVKTAQCDAVIAFQGAHLLSFKPAQGNELLWVSPHCQFSEGTALRGGVPVCFPWFGPHPETTGAPKHGFARNTVWELEQVIENDDNVTLMFGFSSADHPNYHHVIQAGLAIRLGKTAQLSLTATNKGSQACTVSWALHSYHPVSSLNKVNIPALTGRDYLDNLDSHARKSQSGPLYFIGETDRVFPSVETSLVIEDSQPRIAIEHDNCPSVVTWNPGAANAAAITDIGQNQHQNFICVERGAVLDEAWRLAPGTSESGWLEIAEA